VTHATTVIHVPHDCEGVVALTGVRNPRVVAKAGNYRSVLQDVRSQGRKPSDRPILLFIPRLRETYVY
jgi:hypothetical protein